MSTLIRYNAPIFKILDSKHYKLLCNFVTGFQVEFHIFEYKTYMIIKCLEMDISIQLPLSSTITLNHLFQLYYDRSIITGTYFNF